MYDKNSNNITTQWILFWLQRNSFLHLPHNYISLKLCFFFAVTSSSCCWWDSSSDSWHANISNKDKVWMHAERATLRWWSRWWPAVNHLHAVQSPQRARERPGVYGVSEQHTCGPCRRLRSGCCVYAGNTLHVLWWDTEHYVLLRTWPVHWWERHHWHHCELWWYVEDTWLQVNVRAGCVVDVITGLMLDFSVNFLYCQTCTSAKARLGEDKPEFDSWFGDGGVWPWRENRKRGVCKSRGKAHENSSPETCDSGEEVWCCAWWPGLWKTDRYNNQDTGELLRQCHPEQPRELGRHAGSRLCNILPCDLHRWGPPPHPLPRGSHQLVLLPEGTGQRVGTGQPLWECSHSLVTRSCQPRQGYVPAPRPETCWTGALGWTQNKNECIHSKIWTKCPKTGFVGLMWVVAAVCASLDLIVDVRSARAAPLVHEPQRDTALHEVVPMYYNVSQVFTSSGPTSAPWCYKVPGTCAPNWNQCGRSYKKALTGLCDRRALCVR